MLLSGGHGGLIRCSVVPPHVTVQRMPYPTSKKHAYVRTPAKAQSQAKGAPAAEKKSKNKDAGASGGVRAGPGSGRNVPSSTAANGGPNGGPAEAAGGSGAEVVPAVAASIDEGGSGSGTGSGDGNYNGSGSGSGPTVIDDAAVRFGPAAAAALAAV